VFVRDLSYITGQIISDTWWDSKNVGLKCSIPWNNSRHATSRNFYLHCGIVETGSPAIICIISHQVLHHPSKHETSLIGKPFLANVYITKQNKFPVSEGNDADSSLIDESALSTLKWQGSRGTMIVNSQRIFMFDIYTLSILTELTDIMLQTGSKGL
jgi:hypothetical protein